MANNPIEQLGSLALGIKVGPDPQFEWVVSSKGELRAPLVAITLAHDKPGVKLEVLVPRPIT